MPHLRAGNTQISFSSILKLHMSYLWPAQGSYLFFSWNPPRTRFVWKFTSSQSPSRSILSSNVKIKSWTKFFNLKILFALRKWKSMILSEHALKGSGNKLVKEFLSTLESASFFVRALFCSGGSWIWLMYKHINFCRTHSMQYLYSRFGFCMFSSLSSERRGATMRDKSVETLL